ncbi:MAG: GNAT family N-acetyltransferase [Halioglobus sp.]|nr:GNAT family N-acetyltransferase [Halioglobus sp.]
MHFTPVDTANTDEAIRIIAEAFADDPVINWTCNQPATLVPFFEITLPVLIPHQLTYLDPQGRGGASWLGPHQALKWPVKLSSVREIWRLGGLTGVYRMLLSGAKTEKYHPKTPHYYLFAIGVTPGNKGQGLGTALITHILKQCDAEGMPAYLETSKEENLEFYQGHGFKVLQQIRFAASAPPVWLMWREPMPTNA